MFEFGASHKQNWTSIKRFGSVEKPAQFRFGWSRNRYPGLVCSALKFLKDRFE